MFKVNEDLSIYATRGDTVYFSVSAKDNGEAYEFQPNDVVRINIFEKKNCENVVLKKDFLVTSVVEEVNIVLTGKETKLGKSINKPVDYWYEIEINPDGSTQTIVGYDEDGPKIFRIFPEGVILKN